MSSFPSTLLSYYYYYYCYHYYCDSVTRTGRINSVPRPLKLFTHSFGGLRHFTSPYVITAVCLPRKLFRRLSVTFSVYNHFLSSVVYNSNISLDQVTRACTEGKRGWGGKPTTGMVWTFSNSTAKVVARSFPTKEARVWLYMITVEMATVHSRIRESNQPVDENARLHYVTSCWVKKVDEKRFPNLLYFV